MYEHEHERVVRCNSRKQQQQSGTSGEPHGDNGAADPLDVSASSSANDAMISKSLSNQRLLALPVLPLSPSCSESSFSSSSSSSSPSSSITSPTPSTASSTSSMSCSRRWVRKEKIGQGAQGSVYRCEEVGTGRELAAKIIRIQDLSTAEVEAIKREVRTIKQLTHRHLVQYVKASERKQRRLTIYMEFVAGGSLSALVKRGGALPLPRVQKYTRQLCEALAFLHANRIAHRDIKCANVFLTAKQQSIKLGDFGAFKEIGSVSLVAGLKGTPHWMAPEVIREQQTSDDGWLRADIWSLGCAVLEMLTGHSPWQQYSNPLTAMYQIVSSNTIPTIPADATDETASFLRWCLQRDPEDRPTTTQLLAHPFLRKRPSSVPRAASPSGSSAATAAMTDDSPSSKISEAYPHDPETLPSPSRPESASSSRSAPCGNEQKLQRRQHQDGDSSDTLLLAATNSITSALSCLRDADSDERERGSFSHATPATTTVTVTVDVVSGCTKEARRKSVLALGLGLPGADVSAVNKTRKAPRNPHLKPLEFTKSASDSAAISGSSSSNQYESECSPTATTTTSLVGEPLRAGSAGALNQLPQLKPKAPTSRGVSISPVRLRRISAATNGAAAPRPTATRATATTTGSGRTAHKLPPLMAARAVAGT